MRFLGPAGFLRHSLQFQLGLFFPSLLALSGSLQPSHYLFTAALLKICCCFHIFYCLYRFTLQIYTIFLNFLTIFAKYYHPRSTTP